MKFLILVSAVLFNLNAFASAAQAPAFGSLAVQTVKAMYGRKGDSFGRELVKNVATDSQIDETWVVTTTNGATAGSASYQVEIKRQLGGVQAGEESASVVIRYLDSN